MWESLLVSARRLDFCDISLYLLIMNGPVSMNTPPPVPEDLPLVGDSNTTLSQEDNNTRQTTSEDEHNNAKTVGCAGRVRKGLTNIGGWVCGQFLEGIINNIADAAWDSIVQCFDDITGLNGDDNDCDQDE